MNRKSKRIINVGVLGLLLLIVILISLCGGNGGSSSGNGGNSIIPRQPSLVDMPDYTVFVENSASMDGYLKPSRSEFKSALLDLLTDIEAPTNKVTGNLDVNYINEIVIPNINFSDNLSVNDFKEKGGNRGDTQLDDVFNELLSVVDSHQVAILVSDMVLSPPGGAADQFLAEQRNKVKQIFAEKLAEFSGLSCIVLKMESSFEGSYYDFQRGNRYLRAGTKRPYYIICLGHSQHLQQLDERIGLKDDGRVPEEILIFNNVANNLMWETEGASWNRWNKTEKYFNPRMLNSQQGFSFSILANIKNAGVNLNYIENERNYTVSDDRFNLAISAGREKRGIYYSHKLTFTTMSENIRNKDKISLALKRALPRWVKDSHSDNDTRITKESSELNKTYGFAHIIDGIDEAYESANEKKDNIFKLDFTLIKQ